MSVWIGAGAALALWAVILSAAWLVVPEVIEQKVEARIREQIVWQPNSTAEVYGELKSCKLVI